MPRAMPGVMTGMILAIALGAGEVAPLMLVGAVKLAPELPVEVGSDFPFVAIILFVLVFPSFAYWFRAIGNQVSRRHEFEADSYAAAKAKPGLYSMTDVLGLE